MLLDQIEKLYRELPSHHRDRWDAVRFSQLAQERTSAPAPFDGEPATHSKYGLPKLEKNQFGGLASAFHEQIDSWMPTHIEPGAFKNTLANSAERSRVKSMLDHSIVIGKPVHMEEVKEGLAVVVQVSETSVGLDVLTLLRDHVLDEMSIMFDPVEYSFKENAQTKELHRHITEVRLYELGPVAFGANKGAKITVVNSALGAPATVDLAQLAKLVAQELHATAPRIHESDPAAVRAEIQRLTRLLPVQHDYAKELEDLRRYA
jgi:HK97 family phage prohead protease